MLANKKKKEKRKIHIKFNPLQENLTVIEREREGGAALRQVNA